jgi:hypothetical protein
LGEIRLTVHQCPRMPTKSPRTRIGNLSRRYRAAIGRSSTGHSFVARDPSRRDRDRESSAIRGQRQ